MSQRPARSWTGPATGPVSHSRGLQPRADCMRVCFWASLHCSDHCYGSYLEQIQHTGACSTQLSQPSSLAPPWGRIADATQAQTGLQSP